MKMIYLTYWNHDVLHLIYKIINTHRVYENFPHIYLTNSIVLHLIYDNLTLTQWYDQWESSKQRVPQGFIRWKTEFRFIISFVTNSNPHFSISSDQQTSRSFSAGECGVLNSVTHPWGLLRVSVYYV